MKGYFFPSFLLIKGSLSILFFFFICHQKFPFENGMKEAAILILLLFPPQSCVLSRLWFRLFTWDSGSQGSLGSDCFVLWPSISFLSWQRHHNSLVWCYCWDFHCVIQLSTAGQKGCAAEHRMTCCCSTCAPCSPGSWSVVDVTQMFHTWMFWPNTEYSMSSWSDEMRHNCLLFLKLCIKEAVTFPLRHCVNTAGIRAGRQRCSSLCFYLLWRDQCPFWKCLWSSALSPSLLASHLLEKI